MDKNRTVKEHLRIPFTAKVRAFEKINDEFSMCDVWVCALGKNRNLSYIGKEAADDAMPTLYNIPVVGYIYEGEDGKPHMGTHNGEYIKQEDGSYKWRSKCVPYGVVPMQDNFHYEEVTEPNGDVKTYLVGKLILWTGRFPELADVAYSTDYAFNQSMEINVYDYERLEEDKNYINVLSYSYSALCLLGKSDDEQYNVEPCFPEAHVSMDTTYAYDEKFFELMSQMKESLSECFSKTSDGKEAGQKMDNVENAIVNENEEKAEFTDENTPETKDFEENESEEQSEVNEPEQTEDNTTDENFENENAEGSEPADATQESEQGEGDKDTEAYELTSNNKWEIISNAVCGYVSDTIGDGYIDKYIYLIDFDTEYAYVGVCVYYYVDGVSSDEHNKYRVKYAIDDNGDVSIGGSEKVFVSYLTADEVKQLDEMRAGYAALVDYKAEREKKDREDAYDAAIEEFADLAGNEEYEKILENKYSYNSVDELKNACYAVRGKFGLIGKPRKTTSEVHIKFSGEKNTLTVRDRLHEEYGRK